MPRGRCSTLPCVSPKLAELSQAEGHLATASSFLCFLVDQAGRHNLQNTAPNEALGIVSIPVFSAPLRPAVNSRSFHPTRSDARWRAGSASDFSLTMRI
jgi:hypothetical protein